MTKRPVGLTWIFVFLVIRCAGMIGLITCSMTASRIVSLETESACCVETTTASTPFTS